jgi:hypothetical protein
MPVDLFVSQPEVYQVLQSLLSDNDLVVCDVVRPARSFVQLTTTLAGWWPCASSTGFRVAAFTDDNATTLLLALSSLAGCISGSTMLATSRMVGNLRDIVDNVNVVIDCVAVRSLLARSAA